MPLYEFECQECNENFEKLVRIVGTQEVVCPKCGSTKTHKKMSLFAANSRGNGSNSATGGSSCATGGT